MRNIVLPQGEAAPILTLRDNVNESCHHVELGPVDLGGIILKIVRIALMSTNQVGEMNLPADMSEF